MMTAILAELADVDQSAKPIATVVRDATIQLEEAAFDLSPYLDKLDLDPAELVEVEDRLNTVHRILNKYNDTVEDTLAYRAEIAQKLTELESASEDLTTLDKELSPL